MIEEGKITAEEGLKLLQALGEDTPVEVLEAAEAWARFGDAPAKSDPEFDQKLQRFRRLWLVPLAGGILLSLLSAAWMYTALHSFWLVPALLFFLLGVGLVVLGFDSRSSRWIYIDVVQKPGEQPGHIVISFPLAPIRWLLNLFGQHIPAEHKSALDEQILQAVLHTKQSDAPFFVDAHDEDGQRVQVYIG